MVHRVIILHESIWMYTFSLDNWYFVAMATDKNGPGENFFFFLSNGEICSLIGRDPFVVLFIFSKDAGIQYESNFFFPFTQREIFNNRITSTPRDSKTYDGRFGGYSVTSLWTFENASFRTATPSEAIRRQAVTAIAYSVRRAHVKAYICCEIAADTRIYDPIRARHPPITARYFARNHNTRVCEIHVVFQRSAVGSAGESRSVCGSIARRRFLVFFLRLHRVETPRTVRPQRRRR